MSMVLHIRINYEIGLQCIARGRIVRIFTGVFSSRVFMEVFCTGFLYRVFSSRGFLSSNRNDVEPLIDSRFEMAPFCRTPPVAAAASRFAHPDWPTVTNRLTTQVDSQRAASSSVVCRAVSRQMSPVTRGYDRARVNNIGNTTARKKCYRYQYQYVRCSDKKQAAILEEHLITTKNVYTYLLVFFFK